MTSAPGPVWRTLAESHTGASHVRKYIENQDFTGIEPASGRGSAVAVLLADGHGSATSFRSSTGARFAVEVARELTRELFTSARAGAGRSDLKRQMEDDAGKQLVRQWRKKVAKDLELYPIAAEELDHLEERSGAAGRTRVEQDPYLAYGSTLVAAVATDSFMAFWQLGDGDIIVIDEDGRPTRPIEKDDQLLGNETPSLCLPNAWRYFRSSFAGTLAPFVLVSTDGLANSYADEEAFLAFGSDVFRIVTAEGLDAIGDRLSDWLPRISAQGSGDDLSVGILLRTSASEEQA